MKRLSLLALLALVAGGCTANSKWLDKKQHGSNPYDKPVFYTRYLDPNNLLDQAIQRDLNALKSNPRASSTHNELGTYLFAKGFPKDAQLEFERSVYSDKRFYPGWYNLGLVRASLGDFSGAERAFDETLHYKPGHAAAHFQLGLLEEKRGHNNAAVEHYARSFAINHAMLDPKINPRIVDTQLIDEALLKLYPTSEVRSTIRFAPRPHAYTDPPPEPVELEAPSLQAPASEIVTPSAPVTSPAAQPTPQNPAPPAPPKQ